jgi:hypothetical protein
MNKTMHNQLKQAQSPSKSVDGLTIHSWNFSYGPFGLEKAYRSTAPSITQDFTFDPTIISLPNP